MIEKVKKNIFISMAIAAMLYLGFMVYADYKNVIAAFMKFNWYWLPVILLLTFLNYLTRFFKWDYYLRVLKIKLTKMDSFAIFMSGLIMSVTPGKMGELLKAYLVKQVAHEPISRTAPIIIVERITDFISLVLLSLAGALVFNYGRIVVLGTGVFFILLTLIISNKRLSLQIISQIEKIKFLHGHGEKIRTAYESSYNLLRPWPLVYMVLISLVSWSFECLGYYIILINFGINLSILWSTFVYTFSTIAGAITMLPGGLGVTDGSLTFLLVQKNIAKDLAVSSTFIIRVVTLWFAVLIGVISVSFYQSRYGKVALENAGNS
ncbi:MAG: lysylphosphatidylglycerol synthase transmembrane domain-containing protein [Bacteroidota bacterium]|nr:lysylphosphatidylglycerol synthase transmembrane domain-containing protein [Bacteroidota bacterium]MDP4191993.1 lysylphosphatidylglycerol synthase transmembrane domain-containing protein [Bacteroidota bacterium]MDP4195334.1 lysylphosphatidylglycerol synthase transmembrane domain-containing protein [Bacteroidota bacterium]